VSGASITRPDNTRLGVGSIVGAVFLMTLGDALVKLVSADFCLWQLYVTRGLIALPILIGIMRWRGIAIRPTAPGWTYLRAILLVLMWIVYYAALPVLSLSVAAVALYTSPVLIALLSARLIGEPVSLRRWIAVATLCWCHRHPPTPRRVLLMVHVASDPGSSVLRRRHDTDAKQVPE
jgi:drug/metabolite transporter (DMT)-like permease